MIRFVKDLSAKFARGPRGFSSVVSTAAVDRDGEVLIPQGCNAAEYERNPVLLWMHDLAQPIGRCVGIRRSERSLEADFDFAARPDAYEGEWFPDYCRGLVEAGACNAVSVGATVMPGGIRQATQRDKEQFGEDCLRVISKWRLHEISLVSVPANQDALIMAVRKGLVTAGAAVKFGGLAEVPEATKAAEAPAGPKRIRIFVPHGGVDGAVKLAIDGVRKRRGAVWGD
jgi:HK97 family phage prohead protease